MSARLTCGELDILARLIAAEGGIVSHEELLAAISRRPLDSDPRSVGVPVSRIRRKRGARRSRREPIVTAAGFGYPLSAPAPDDRGSHST